MVDVDAGGAGAAAEADATVCAAVEAAGFGEAARRGAVSFDGALFTAVAPELGTDDVPWDVDPVPLAGRAGEENARALAQLARLGASSFGVEGSGFAGAEESDFAGEEDPDLAGAEDSDLAGAEDSDLAGVEDSDLAGVEDSDLAVVEVAGFPGADDADFPGAEDTGFLGAFADAGAGCTVGTAAAMRLALEVGFEEGR